MIGYAPLITRDPHSNNGRLSVVEIDAWNPGKGIYEEEHRLSGFEGPAQGLKGTAKVARNCTFVWDIFAMNFDLCDAEELPEELKEQENII